MTIAATHITAAAIQKYNALSITVVFLQHGASSVPLHQSSRLSSHFFPRLVLKNIIPMIHSTDTVAIINISELFIKVKQSNKQCNQHSQNSYDIDKQGIRYQIIE